MRHSDLIQKLTLSEKAQLLSGKDVWHTHEIDRLRIPSMTLSDGPSGLRKQAGEGDHLGLNASTKATCIPSASTLANGWDPAIAEEMGAVVGADACAQGVQVLLGPGLNTKRSALCGRSFEYYSEDPYLSGKLAAGFIRGVQSKGISACAKHFAANSQELLRMHSDSIMDERTLRELYLTNFEIAIKEGKPHAVMTSYNRLNGTYTNENPHLYEILRREWDYDGMVVTDWGGSNDFTAGVRAGMNLEMPGSGDDSASQLIHAVTEGTITEAEIDQRVDELLDVILKMTAVEPVMVDEQRHHDLVREAAEKCAVLLKNKEGLLPLSSDTKVALIGDFAAHPRYQGAGSSMVNAVRVDATLPLLSKYFTEAVGFAQGYERQDKPNDALLTEAVDLAKRADVVLLYIGLPEGFETEGLDRTHMRIPDNQISLIEHVAAVNPHIVAVLSCGSAVEMPWIENCQALLYGGLGGEAAAEAMLRILSGVVNPGGKLAETFPVVYEDMPVSQYYPGKERTAEYREAIFVGYRYFVTTHKPVRFPFGYGLSYTTFAYDNLEVSEKEVCFDLRNTGNRAGDEVVQLYVAKPESFIFRPEMELKGFVRVHLKAGETRRVIIPLDDYAFRYFNVESKRFEVEDGVYNLIVASSSIDIHLTGSLMIRGTRLKDPYSGKKIDEYRHCQLDCISDEAFGMLLGHPVTDKRWKRSIPLDMNDTVRQLVYARNPVARLVYRVLTKKVNMTINAGKPDLNLLFIYNIPFRGMAKMMNGMVSMSMAEDILLMVNGHWHRGLCRLILDYFNRPKLE